ncbi:MAG TPA: pyrroline-5-carboxylate reductase [Bacteroidota bacterium]|nr:pyrroline-5-carboxylate reductase [Bacteroidota bacterium]
MQTKESSRDHEEPHRIDRPIAILGAGNMGSALLKGIINAKLTPAKKIIASDVNQAKLQALASDWKVRTTQDVREAVKASEIILLCVKPQTLPTVLESIKETIRPEHLIISIVAGKRIGFIQTKIEKKVGIARVMPNIAAVVDQAASAIAFGEFVTAPQKDIATVIFEAVGEVVVIAEEQLDAVTGLSGSGPAYIYMVIEALIDGGVKMGLARDVATKLAIQTVLGSATLVKTSGLHPAILRDQVTTPGGTTINAIHELESHGLRSMLINAVETATNRSAELNKG